LIQSAKDISYLLNWDNVKIKSKTVQRQLFLNLTPDEEIIVNVLREKGDLDIDTLLIESKILPAKAATILLNMEFEGVLRCLPGRVYRLI
jgi:DNA processing protein